MSDIQMVGNLTVTAPIKIISASRGKLVAEFNGVRQVVYAGGTLVLTAQGTITPTP